MTMAARLYSLNLINPVSWIKMHIPNVIAGIANIFNEAINRNKPEKEKTFYEYNLPKELIGML